MQDLPAARQARVAGTGGLPVEGFVRRIPPEAHQRFRMILVKSS